MILERPAKQVIGDRSDLIGIIRKCLIYTEEDIPFYEMSPDWKNNRDDWLKRVKRYTKILHSCKLKLYLSAKTSEELSICLLYLELRVESSYKESWFLKKFAQFRLDRSHVCHGLSEKTEKILQMKNSEKVWEIQRRLFHPRRTCVKNTKYLRRIFKLSELPGETYRWKRAESGWTWIVRPRQAKKMITRSSIAKIAENLSQNQDRLLSSVEKNLDENPENNYLRSKNIFRQVSNIRKLARNFKAEPHGFSTFAAYFLKPKYGKEYFHKVWPYTACRPRVFTWWRNRKRLILNPLSFIKIKV